MEYNVKDMFENDTPVTTGRKQLDISIKHIANARCTDTGHTQNQQATRVCVYACGQTIEMDGIIQNRHERGRGAGANGRLCKCSLFECFRVDKRWRRHRLQRPVR
jgi:hypothetical protein